MQELISSIVQADTKEQAITKAEPAFNYLVDGGGNPLFTSYTLIGERDTENTLPSEKTALRINTDEGRTTMRERWEETMLAIELIIETTDDDDFTIEPGSTTYARAYRLYDEQSRPVTSKQQLTKLSNQPDAWIVTCFMTY